MTPTRPTTTGPFDRRGPAFITGHRALTKSSVICGLATVLLAVAVAVHGLDPGVGAAPAVVAARQDDSAAQATATRAAELEEVAALQTQVADLQTQVASLQSQVAAGGAEASPAVTPTPVPPVSMGQEVTFDGTWAITVVDATSRLAVAEHVAEGIFIELSIRITNNSNDPNVFPFERFVLTDDKGRSVGANLAASSSLEGAQSRTVEAWRTVDLRYVFDVLPDAGESFVFESTDDPLFRIAVTLAQRG
jgi:hypothetical protein